MRRLAALLALCAWLAPANAVAERPIPIEAWTPEARLALARVLVAESDYSRPDHAAIAWVLAKRWPDYCENTEQVTFAEYVRRYASLWKPEHTLRKQMIRALPWAPTSNPYGRRPWGGLRRWIQRWADGSVEDPCPAAMHWGGPDVDSFPAGAVFAACGATRNKFYSEGDTTEGARKTGGSLRRWVGARGHFGLCRGGRRGLRRPPRFYSRGVA